MSTYYQLLLMHTFSHVDDPQESDQNGTLKWFHSEQGYRLNQNYIFQNRATEISELTLQYLLDHIGKAAAAVAQKPEQLFTAERKALQDYIVTEGGVARVSGGKIVKLKASTNAMGCGEVSLTPGSGRWIVKMLRFNWGYMLQRVFLAAAYEAHKTDAAKDLLDEIKQNESEFFSKISEALASQTEKTQELTAIPLGKEVSDKDNTLASAYLSLRRIAVTIGLPISTTEPLSRIILKLYNHLYGKKNADEEDQKICDALNDTWEAFLKAGKTPDESKEGKEVKDPLDFKFVIEQDWQGFFLHEFVRSEGFLALRFGLVPAEICEIALIAFGVSSEVSNPAQTLQLLVDRYVDKPTVLMAAHFDDADERARLWKHPFVDTLHALLNTSA